MDKPASNALVSYEESRVKQWLMSCGWSENIAGNFAVQMVFQREMAAKIAARHLKYLPLPSSIASVAVDPLYQAALSFGRLRFYDDQLLEVDGEWFRCPMEYSVQDIADGVRSLIAPSDARLAVATPLAWRVGFVVGWLSGVVAVQKREAYGGMVLLAALVSPLLLSPQRSMQQSRKRLGSARK